MKRYIGIKNKDNEHMYTNTNEIYSIFLSLYIIKFLNRKVNSMIVATVERHPAYLMHEHFNFT
jgi:hypothetical protein